MRYNNKKGQYFAFDAITAVIIFIVTISLVASFWFNIQSTMNAYDSESYRTAIRISDTLVSKGSPSESSIINWIWYMRIDQLEMINVAGFGEDTGLPVLDEELISDLDAAVGDVSSDLERKNYDRLKQVLRTGYEVNIQIYEDGTYNQGDSTSTTYNIGLSNYTNTNVTVASFTRVVTIHTNTDEYIRGNLQVNIWTE